MSEHPGYDVSDEEIAEFWTMDMRSFCHNWTEWHDHMLAEVIALDIDFGRRDRMARERVR